MTRPYDENQGLLVVQARDMLTNCSDLGQIQLDTNRKI
jgi:hypothetical protein